MERIKELYKKHYGCCPDTLEPLSASASNRRYFRLKSAEGGCVGAIGTDSRENKAFVYLSRHLSSKGIPVPSVLEVSDDAMTYLQEDLGEEVLYDMLCRARRTGEGLEEVEEMLCNVMRMLPDIQFKGAEDMDFSICYPQPSFDRRNIMFDLNYFKYCFLKASGLEFDEFLLQEDFERLADDLLKYDTDTFMYRDFNSRNVMICGGSPYFIDFQGGRRGPIYYDVASFVWHARSSYSECLKERMLESYMDSLSGYMEVDRKEFRSVLRIFVLFRMLQVLGAYGFRGWTEHKTGFIVSLPSAIKALAEFIERPFEDYPYLMKILKKLTEMERFSETVRDGILEVRVTSFSYKKGIPEDPSGNGGGYVFDCRSIHNPGRYPQYKNLTGKDGPVVKFLEDDGEVAVFLSHVYGVIDPHVETFSDRGFTSLMVSFGCTGGQHRSVYCAEHLAHHLAQKYPHVKIHLIHREQGIDEYFNAGHEPMSE